MASSDPFSSVVPKAIRTIQCAITQPQTPASFSVQHAVLHDSSGLTLVRTSGEGTLPGTSPSDAAANASAWGVPVQVSQLAPPPPPPLPQQAMGSFTQQQYPQGPAYKGTDPAGPSSATGSPPAPRPAAQFPAGVGPAGPGSANKDGPARGGLGAPPPAPFDPAAPFPPPYGGMGPHPGPFEGPYGGPYGHHHGGGRGRGCWMHPHHHHRHHHFWARRQRPAYDDVQDPRYRTFLRDLDREMQDEIFPEVWPQGREGPQGLQGPGGPHSHSPGSSAKAMAELEQAQREISRSVERSLERTPWGADLLKAWCSYVPWARPWEVQDKGAEYNLRFELPGLSKADVDVKVDEANMLSIRAKQHASEAGSGLWLSSAASQFQRELRLPEGVKREAISAEMKDGVLSITVPKDPPPQDPAKAWKDVPVV